MKRRWWIAVVALVGVMLAVLLLPRPDTGEDIAPAAAPSARAPATDRPTSPRAAGATRPGAQMQPVDETNAVQGVRPELAAIREARNKPEVVYAGKVMGPWSAIRYVLLKEGSPEAKALGDEINTEVMADLRKIRTAEDPLTIWPVLEPKMEALASKIADSPWGADETIVKSLERYRTTLTDFHDADPAGGSAPEPEPAQE